MHCPVKIIRHFPRVKLSLKWFLEKVKKIYLTLFTESTMERHNILIITVLLSFSLIQNSIANECSNDGYSCITSAESSTKILVNNKTKVETSFNVLSRKKRSFGGVEPTNYVLAFTGVFGVPGWLTQGLEAFSDINFHLLGNTALGKLRIFFSHLFPHQILS